jgi:MoxR-like ATPase
MNIVKKRLPGIESHLLEQVVSVVQQFRQRKLVKVPGVSETIDWAESLLALGYREINAGAFDQTLGCILKSAEDISQVRAEGVNEFI